MKTLFIVLTLLNAVLTLVIATFGIYHNWVTEQAAQYIKDGTIKPEDVAISKEDLEEAIVIMRGRSKTIDKLLVAFLSLTIICLVILLIIVGI